MTLTSIKFIYPTRSSTHALTKNTTVPALKAWLARHGQDFKFRKAQLMSKPQVALEVAVLVVVAVVGGGKAELVAAVVGREEVEPMSGPFTTRIAPAIPINP
eukprot:g72074.t1